jgi:enolase-phosphatase E1
MRSEPTSTDTQVRSILLDIEGTTTPVDFIYKVLFPYARMRVEDFVRSNWSSEPLASDITRLAEEHGADLRRNLQPPAWREDRKADSVVAYVHWLMDQDRKSTGLKSIQGKIWQAGYETGELRGEVFPDVPPAFVRWRDRNRTICIFSSGSVLAQRLLFSSSTEGDLTPFIWKFFDTTTGPKAESESYRKIALACARSPEEMLFVSDVVSELDAAQSAGLETALCIRGESPPPAGPHRTIRSFDEIA